MRACAASSRRSETMMSPLTWPLMTAFGVRISPLTRPFSLTVSTAWAPCAVIEPSTAPSMCKPPLNSMSPRIVVPSAIRVVIADIERLLRFSLPNIVFLLGLGRVIPRKILVTATAVALGHGTDAIRFKPVGQHDGALNLLEILEGIVDSGIAGLLSKILPFERLQRAVADPRDRQGQLASRFRSALEVLRQRGGEVPRPRIRHRLEA